jgi:hypothetical protein
MNKITPKNYNAAGKTAFENSPAKVWHVNELNNEITTTIFPYKVYVATLTWNAVGNGGSGVPIVRVLQNTLGEDLDWRSVDSETSSFNADVLNLTVDNTNFWANGTFWGDDGTMACVGNFSVTDNLIQLDVVSSASNNPVVRVGDNVNYFAKFEIRVYN